MVFSAPSFDDHHKVVFCNDTKTGLRAIIAIHRTGPKGRALGGCRMVNYADENEALNDVLRLSKGMTYKAACAGLALGGGKSVIIGDPNTQKTPELLRAMGKFVEDLGGKYITSVDVGISGADVAVMQETTKWAVGAGDPSPMTALGVYKGLQACIRYKLGKESFKGLKVAISGIGKVGYGLAEYLAQEGASLIVADVNQDAVKKAVSELGAQAVDVDAIWDVEADALAPCALGGILNDKTIPRIKAPIIGGGANNQLSEDRHAEALAEKGILYAPDYVINAGGLIMVDSEVDDYTVEEAKERTNAIYDALLGIFKRAEAENETTLEAAQEFALERYRTSWPEAAE